MSRFIQLIFFSILLGISIVAITKVSHTGNPEHIVIKSMPPLQYKFEVVSSPAAQAKGLSGRKSLAEGTGMMFTFDKPRIQCMWNKDVRFPLRVLFLSDSGSVINEAVMPAHSEKPVCSEEPVRLVAEINP